MMPDSISMLPKEILELKATQDAMDILKERFQQLFDTFDDVMPKSPYPGKGSVMGDTFTKLMGMTGITSAIVPMAVKSA